MTRFTQTIVALLVAVTISCATPTSGLSPQDEGWLRTQHPELFEQERCESEITVHVINRAGAEFAIWFESWSPVRGHRVPPGYSTITVPRYSFRHPIVYQVSKGGSNQRLLPPIQSPGAVECDEATLQIFPGKSAIMYGARLRIVDEYER